MGKNMTVKIYGVSNYPVSFKSNWEFLFQWNCSDDSWCIEKYKPLIFKLVINYKWHHCYHHTNSLLPSMQISLWLFTPFQGMCVGHRGLNLWWEIAFHGTEILVLWFMYNCFCTSSCFWTTSLTELSYRTLFWRTMHSEFQC